MTAREMVLKVGNFALRCLSIFSDMEGWGVELERWPRLFFFLEVNLEVTCTFLYGVWAIFFTSHPSLTCHFFLALREEGQQKVRSSPPNPNHSRPAIASFCVPVMPNGVVRTP